MPSGCYPLDSYYKSSEFAGRLSALKKTISQSKAPVPPDGSDSE